MKSYIGYLLISVFLVSSAALNAVKTQPEYLKAVDIIKFSASPLKAESFYYVASGDLEKRDYNRVLKYLSNLKNSKEISLYGVRRIASALLRHFLWLSSLRKQFKKNGQQEMMEYVESLLLKEEELYQAILALNPVVGLPGTLSVFAGSLENIQSMLSGLVDDAGEFDSLFNDYAYVYGFPQVQNNNDTQRATSGSDIEPLGNRLVSENIRHGCQ